MKIEYGGICANVLRHYPLLCTRCVFFQTFACTNKFIFNYVLCSLNGFEKDPGYIFKI